MIKLIEVKGMPDFKLFLKYENGKEGVVDLSYIERRGIFDIWNEPGKFQSVYMNTEVNAPAWSDELDLDPFNLYLKLIGKTFEEYQKEKQTVS